MAAAAASAIGPYKCGFCDTEGIAPFCSKRLDPKKMDLLIKANPLGLSMPDLDHKLREGDYNAVLTAVWAERDRPKRLEWLRSHAGSHVPLLYEWGMAEAAADCTKETVIRVALKQFATAHLRARQDAACVEKGKADTTVNLLYDIYIEALERLYNKKVSSSGAPVELMQLEEFQIRLSTARAKVKETLLSLTAAGLPDPKWVAKHGGSFFLENPETGERLGIEPKGHPEKLHLYDELYPRESWEGRRVAVIS